MIPPELEAKILRYYYAERWKIGTIATQLGVHHTTVKRVLAQAGVPILKLSSRPSLVDPFIPFIIETIEKYPTLTASRLYEMVRQRGYTGAPDAFRSIISRLRPKKKAEAYLRLRTLPGEQAQVDWAHFGKITIGRATRPLLAFVMVLSWSRQIFVRFFLNQGMSNFLRGHVEAFEFLKAIPRILLYDNLKSAVLERSGDAIRFHPTLLHFAGHYRYQPRPVAVGRGNEKGRVERAIRYIRQAFFMARPWSGLEDLNEQVLAWCMGASADRRCPEDSSMTVREALEQDRENMLPLPDNPYPVDEKLEVKVGKTPYVRFDLNDYSVPYTYTRTTLVVVADEARVRVLDGNNEVARHARSYDKGQQIEDPAHVADLVEYKRQGRRHRSMDRLHYAAPSSREMLMAVAERGGNLGSVTAGLIRLLDRFGAQEMETVIAEAVRKGTPHLAAVRQILDQRLEGKGSPPPIPVALPGDTRVRDVFVKPHSLDSYDKLQENEDEEDTYQ